MTRHVSVPVERLERWLSGFAERHGETLAEADEHEVRLTGGDGARAGLTVPFPPLPEGAGDARDRLLAHVSRPRTIGVLLVRRRAHAVGVFDGDNLVASKVDTSYVQATTKAGGWSQHRYARRRANQATAAFADAAETAARVLLPHLAGLDALVCGGDRAAVDAVLGDPRLRGLAALRAEPWLAVPEPRLRVLQGTPAQFRAIRIWLDP
jgi:hypothetical protein